MVQKGIGSNRELCHLTKLYRLVAYHCIGVAYPCMDVAFPSMGVACASMGMHAYVSIGVA